MTATKTARELVEGVPDPEMPWVTLGDLGIVREVTTGPGESVRVALTPTYLGCPAIEAMRTDVAEALTAQGYRVEGVELRLDPPWTSAAITERGRQKLAEVGIAPPHLTENADMHVSGTHSSTPLSLGVRCPHCGGIETALLSRFGASPCQELRRCSSCGEPFPAVRS
ncbi:phenylacetate-CoA oxygenase subunit PaaJ [Actinospica durhamensis]|uniref:Phenylacetate-CoA oxygenase subunit PaaJ n=1 Tax=Actinospica durhamensis TaxID=1508375 RepID=A0A941EQ16_9ACTN|nr:1,2-phenylacetyl-CoA epoxidase subunit PaaD [Actinospica durhamensis]MBR7835240.1 phenylacetate-CoA oxygenase subunit PaaJ [Actinospica durhamensis]